MSERYLTTPFSPVFHCWLSRRSNLRLRVPKQAQDNITELNNIIWGTCNTNLPTSQCDANMAWFVESLQDACAEDIKDANAVVLQTLKGMFALTYNS